MKTLTFIVGIAAAASATLGHAQSMFRGDAAHSGIYAGKGPREFHRVKWSFATGGRIVSSPVTQDGVTNRYSWGGSGLW